MSTQLVNLHKIEMSEALSDLPSILPFDVTKDARGDDLFLAALGFEERCLWIPELLAQGNNYKTNRAIYFEYTINRNENELNKPRLLSALGGFAHNVRPMPLDSQEFSSQLRTLLSELCAFSSMPQITFDISVCSSRLLITTLTVLFEFNVALRVVYSEACIYHPTRAEYEADPQKWTSDENLGLARGVSSISRSQDHPGSRRDILPEAVIAFPTFKPERIRAILADIDPSLRLRPDNRVIWLVGKPHLQEDWWRADVQRSINEIPASAPCHEVDTFDYKKTLEALERVYEPLDCNYLVNIAPLGSKMQSLGVMLFWLVHPEIGLYFASPREFNTEQYSEGCKGTWSIDFGPLLNTRQLLNTVGTLRKEQ
jgi:hypothetical protein